jgi:DNA-binding helix-hairpin-helix protein with protein kinase domain
MIEFRTLDSADRRGTVAVVEDYDAPFGREGSVLLTADRRQCVKCFRQDGTVDLVSKLIKTIAMLSPAYGLLRDMAREGVDARGVGGFAWPIFLAFDDTLISPRNRQGFVGYGMPYLDGTHALTRLHASSSALSRSATLEDRLQVCEALAFLFAIAHHHDLCVGDTRPDNVRVRKADGQWQVWLLDIDAFQIEVTDREGQVHLLTCERGDDDYISARLARKLREPSAQGCRKIRRLPEDDLHGFAVMCFQTLIGGHHPLQTSGRGRTVAENAADRIFPYSGKGGVPRKGAPVEAYRRLPAPLRDLFEQAFLNEIYAPAPAWIEVLSAARAELGPAAKRVSKPLGLRPKTVRTTPSTSLKDTLESERMSRPDVRDLTPRQMWRDLSVSIKLLAGSTAVLVVLLILIALS